MSTQPTDSAKKASSNDLNRQAGLYSLAATAAGVSLMVLAQPAAGEVVITNKNIPIPFCDGLTGPCPVSVYLNNDGIADFQLSLYDSLRTHRSTIRLTVEPLQGGAVVGTPPRTHRYGYASALLRGSKIGPSAHFLAGQTGIEESKNFEGTGVTAPPHSRPIRQVGRQPPQSFSWGEVSDCRRHSLRVDSVDGCHLTEVLRENEVLQGYVRHDHGIRLRNHRQQEPRRGTAGSGLDRRSSPRDRRRARSSFTRDACLGHGWFGAVAARRSVGSLTYSCEMLPSGTLVSSS